MREHIAKAAMLIRCPVAEVFDAFVDPGKITKFWLQATTGPLAKDAQVQWRFMVPGATEVVNVTAFEPQRHIVFTWSDGIRVSMTFEDFGKRGTRIGVEVTGFQGQDQDKDKVDPVVTATEGFSIVLCDLKTLLETGRSANLVKDKAELIATS
jgi:uncharacterized protein YndB with AHSA1/START domain